VAPLLQTLTVASTVVLASPPAREDLLLLKLISTLDEMMLMVVTMTAANVAKIIIDLTYRSWYLTECKTSKLGHAIPQL